MTPSIKTTSKSDGTFNNPVITTSLSLATINANSTQPYSGSGQDKIPQLDGDITDQANHLQCETCHEIFENRDEYDEHDKLEYCCDDCGICYATKIDADFHALQVHPDKNYAKEYISDTTKKLFAENLKS